MTELGRMGMGPDRVTAQELLGLGSNAAIVEHLQAIADEMLEQREKEVGPEAWAAIERFVLLRTIDALWVEHLTELDDMRRGIGLRGYSQQDPLNEFRKEAFGLYEELSGFIRHQVAAQIFRVTVQEQPAAAAGGVFPMAGPGQPAQGGAMSGATGTAGTARLTPALGAAGVAARGAASGNGSRNGGPGQGARRQATVLAGGSSAAALGGGAGGQQARPGYTPTGAKIGRNDICWCGSGLKYKKCHGK
jgi:preprotein translocase subunit SecA